MDLTKPVKEILLQRYPYLMQPPEGKLDTPLPPPPSVHWKETDSVIPMAPEGLTAGPSSEADYSPTWHDVALSIAAELMQNVRDQVRTKLHYTTSAVSTSLLLADCLIDDRALPETSFWPR